MLANSVADQLATQGQAFTFALPGNLFSDPDAGDIVTITVSQSNGDALPSWLSYASGMLSGTPGAADAGIVRVRITAADSGAPAFTTTC